MYTGIFFEEKELREINKMAAQFIRATSYLIDSENRWNHPKNEYHVTLWMGPCEKEFLNKRVSVIVDGIGSSKRAIALRVKRKWGGDLSKNKIPHITIMINSAIGGKPVDSNRIVNWLDMEEFELEGYIKEHD